MIALVKQGYFYTLKVKRELFPAKLGSNGFVRWPQCFQAIQTCAQNQLCNIQKPVMKFHAVIDKTFYDKLDTKYKVNRNLLESMFRQRFDALIQKPFVEQMGMGICISAVDIPHLDQPNWGSDPNNFDTCVGGGGKKLDNFNGWLKSNGYTDKTEQWGLFTSCFGPSGTSRLGIFYTSTKNPTKFLEVDDLWFGGGTTQHELGHVFGEEHTHEKHRPFESQQDGGILAYGLTDMLYGEVQFHGMHAQGMCDFFEKQLNDYPGKFNGCSR